jgi:hypothetical protein
MSGTGLRVSTRTFSLFAALLLLAVALVPAAHAADGEVTVTLAAAGGSGVTGTAVLSADKAGTRVSIDVRGMQANASAQVSLHAGTCAQPSASFSELPGLQAGGNGVASAKGRVLFRGEEVQFNSIVDGQHVIAIGSAGRVLACGVVGKTAATLQQALLAEGERLQVMQFNPSAALQKRIFADGFVPNSPESRVVVEATSFTLQRAEHMRTGAVRVYHARTGDWGNVRSYQRGTAGESLGRVLLAEAEKRQVIQFNPAAALQKRIFADGFVPNSGEFRLQH